MNAISNYYNLAEKLYRRGDVNDAGLVLELVQEVQRLRRENREKEKPIARLLTKGPKDA